MGTSNFYGKVTEVNEEWFGLEIKEEGRLTSSSCAKLEGAKYNNIPLLTEEDKADVKEVAS